jgi:L-ascorbate metabolism protein UlaG (beta-lactamase superfamily)
LTVDFRLIRNATLRLRYGGVSLLIDPDLAPRHGRPSFRGVSPNPTVELPVPPDEVLAGVEAAVVSHLHTDHFDTTARERLSRALPIFCRSGDEEAMRAMGFADVRPLAGEVSWRGVTVAPVAGQHGSGLVLADMGSVMGVVLRHPAEPTVYWAGDTVLTPAVRETIVRVRPDVVVTHSSGAVWGDGTLIVMDAAQTVAVCDAAPTATVVAVHLEALDHGTVSRAALRAAAREAGVADERLLIPADGETLRFDARPAG